MVLLLIMAIENENDRELLLGIYQKLFPLIVKICYDIVHNHDTAHDLAQETVIKLIEKVDVLRDIPSKEKVAHYVKTAAMRTAINYYNKQKRNGTPISLTEMDLDSEGFNDPSPSVQDTIENRDQISALGSVIKSLSNKQRQILYFKYYHDMSSKEIAAELGTSAGYVDVCVSRTKQIIRKHYEKEGLTDNV